MSLSDELAREMLKAISTTGAVHPENAVIKPVIYGSLENIMDYSSGLPRLKSKVINKFQLIIAQPLILSALSSFEIRCCLCRSVISYPAWHHDIRYNVNHFHYFICFDKASADKPNMRCYKPIHK